ncbi:MAG: aspartate aminotransferase family protein [Ilumatobacter sp.]|nr:aspartate aminotransferase family protein [Ilumatobacter sp.]
MPGAFLHPFAKPSRERFPSITHGKGSLVWDHTGHEMIDAMASLWYCQIGHGRGDMADAIAGQVRQIEAYSCFDPFTNGPADALAEKIANLTPMPDARVFFTNSGSEAIDSAMKLARLTQVLDGQPERRLIISRVRGYHGTNYGGTSAQGLPLNKEGYGTLLDEVVQVAADDIEALSRLMAENSNRIAAVLTEAVQGAAGVYPPNDGYLDEARRLCDQHGALLIFDEVITGFGRLGTWFAAEHFDVVPDLTAFAKGVTSGYMPLGGVIVGRRVSEALESDRDFILRHGYTYSGHAAACAAGLKNIEILEKNKLLRAASAMGYRLERGLRAIADDGGVDHVRGVGAVFAVGLRGDQNAVQLRDAMLKAGVITRAIGTDTITYCPPLVTTDEQIDTIVDVLAEAVA